MDVTFLERLIALLQDYLSNYDASNAGKLYITAVTSLGTDASPNDLAPDEFGCAETVDDIHRKAFGYFIGHGALPSLSTAILFTILRNRVDEWCEVTVPKAGDVVISPTGYGNGHVDGNHGHVGIVSKDGAIMSNDSASGIFKENYTLASWQQKFAQQGGFPVKFYRKI